MAKIPTRTASTLLLVVLALIISFEVHAQSAATASNLRTESIKVDLNQEFEFLELDNNFKLYEDISASATIDDVAQVFEDEATTQFSVGDTNIGYSSSAWWVKLSFHNPQSAPKEIILRQAYPLIDNLQLWTRSYESHWSVKQYGDKFPFSHREIYHREFLFPLIIPARSTKEYFLRYESEGSLDIALSIHEPQHLLSFVGTQQLIYGLYYGGFMVLVLYNLFIFIAVRDKAFLYYLLYIFFYGLYMGAHNGLTFQYFWPNHPQIGNEGLLVTLSLSLVFALQFSTDILNIKEFSKLLNRIAKCLMIACVVAIPAVLTMPYAFMAPVMTVLTLTIMPLFFVMGVLRLASGYRPARYFMLAWTALIFSVIVYVLKVFGVLPRTFFTENGFQIGSIIEMVLLSLALGSRMTELKQQSHTDALTEIGNRRRFDDVFPVEFERAQRNKQPLALLMIDIDYFKKLNDTFGHDAGDQALRAVATTIKTLTRKPMLPCRFGGEEFAVILPRTDSAAAKIVAERIRQTIAEKPMAKREVTVSVGVASTDMGHFTSSRAIMNAADECLYLAKEMGRNRVCLFSEAPQKQAPIAASTTPPLESTSPAEGNEPNAAV